MPWYPKIAWAILRVMAADLTLPAALESELTGLLARGLELEAIRRCRQETGADLATATAAVRALARPAGPATEVWFPPHRRSFFAIPVAELLPSGPLELHCADGRVQLTDISAIARFGISPQAAAARIGAELARPRPPPPGPHRFDGQPVTSAQRGHVAGRVLEILAPHLNPSQVAELRELHEHHEWLLVAEHGTQFLDDADGRLSAEDFERVSEGRVALGGYPLAPAYQQDD